MHNKASLFPTDSTGITSPAAAQQDASEYSDLTESVGFTRSTVNVISTDVRKLHNNILNREWRQDTVRRSKQGVQSLLDDISDLGFSWNDVARLSGVSVPAVRKWRRGGQASGDNRMKLAALLAACDILGRHFMVEEVASWFETPMPETPITPMDLYCANRVDLVFELASANMESREILDEFDPNWRKRYDSPFEVVEGEDGTSSIQLKESR
ncbi:hypothetical protein PG2029B_1097 [Bifidobacterium pseudolongum subsp. globosum]|uniref:Uncharacterized protein n=1 Tax=Bifidobacterium pseudolongum subsp. globosum TaxID=1690 RepID=A0A4Q5AGK4_9BIFI|nr:hypothetical protein [Bifidobacterium pseudolongum]RYQ26500.1 hypothetical protein PG2032B_1096 [Bifidobacterium pseudolongum subsp. globosum]RYQ28492.1 hypothetical protein PG2029B_1097 [Bifidobacterium pseudolongum subsp. globosum]